jgi:hypothetical protein
VLIELKIQAAHGWIRLIILVTWAMAGSGQPNFRLPPKIILIVGPAGSGKILYGVVVGQELGFSSCPGKEAQFGPM